MHEQSSWTNQVGLISVSFHIARNDFVVSTPDGEIELGNQVRFDLGDAASNIEIIHFSDSALDEAGIKARALTDAATFGNDVIRGTLHADEITGFAGNDVLTGRNGADTFVFRAGNGLDRVTDFSLADDAVRFDGLQFADLGIVQNGNTLRLVTAVLTKRGSILHAGKEPGLNADGHMGAVYTRLPLPELHETRPWRHAKVPISDFGQCGGNALSYTDA